jgi:hypothetical protein
MDARTEQALDAAILRTARDLPEFCSNDVWERVREEDVPDNRRLLGLRIKAAASEGLISQTEWRVESELAHGQTVSRWDSNIFWAN